MTKIMSVFLAILMAFSCVVLASADATAPETAGINFEVKLDSAARKITAEPATYNGVPYETVYSIKPELEGLKLENGNTVFINAVFGTKYEITGTIVVDGNEVSDTVEVIILKDQAAPEITAAKIVTSTSIEVPTITNGEYMIEGEGIENAAWGSATKWTGLTPDTLYTISIRYKAVENQYYAGAIRTIVVRTLKAANDEVPAVPVLKDMDMTSITVEKKAGVEYSIDLKTWNSEGKFTGLKAGTDYNVYARYEYDATEQDAGKVSAPLAVKTNTRAVSPATLSDCKVTIEEKDIYYANQTFLVTVQVKSTYITNKAEYGDTVYIPVAYQIDDEAPVAITRIQGSKFEVNVDPLAKNANKTVRLSIIYAKMKYVGGNTWLNVDENTSESYKIEIGAEYTFFTRFVEALNAALNFLFDTAPGALAGFLKNDMVSDYFNLIFGLGDGTFGDFDLLGFLGGFIG